MVGGVRLSKLCFGCEPLGGTDWGEIDVLEITHAIQLGLDIGVNFFDTAAVYGLHESEIRLAKALGNKRHDVVIATKGGLSWNSPKVGRAGIRRDSSKKSLESDVYGSLKRMGLDYLPIFFVHWPDDATKFEETFSTLQSLKNQGLIGSIGCSNFNVSQLSEAMLYASIEFVQGPINILQDGHSDELLEFCNKNNLQFVAYNCLASGLLTGKYTQSSSFGSDDRRSRLSDFSGEQFRNNLVKVEFYEAQAKNKHMSLLEFSLEYVASRPSIVSVITGIKSRDQLLKNFSALEPICGR